MTSPSLRPALSTRQRRAAAAAGAVGLPMIAVGTGIVVLIALMQLASVAMIGVFGPADDSFTPSDFASAAALTVFDLPSIALLAIGISVAVAGFVLSWLILRRHNFERAAVTVWASLGVSLLPGIFIGVLAASIGLAVADSAQFAQTATIDANAVFTIAAIAIDAALSIIVGAVVWVIMARALTPRSST